MCCGLNAVHGVCRNSMLNVPTKNSFYCLHGFVAISETIATCILVGLRLYHRPSKSPGYLVLFRKQGREWDKNHVHGVGKLHSIYKHSFLNNFLNNEQQLKSLECYSITCHWQYIYVNVKIILEMNALKLHYYPVLKYIYVRRKLRVSGN